MSVAENTLNRQFIVAIRTRVEGWLYLAVILDLYSRLMIGWAMGHWLSVQLAEQALTMALATRTHWQSSCATRVSAASMPP